MRVYLAKHSPEISLVNSTWFTKSAAVNKSPFNTAVIVLAKMSSISALRDFQTLGCENQLKCALGARVYLDLECDKRVTSLEKCYDSDLNLVYLRGRREGAIVTFVPVLSSQPLNFLDLEKIQKKFIEISNNFGITLAICDTSSNILYYQVTLGIVDKK